MTKIHGLNKTTSVLKEIARRDLAEQERAKLPKFVIEDFCFPKQIEFIRDKAKFKTAVCSRRAGKTVGCAADLVETAQSIADINVLYLTLNRKSAKRIIWKDLMKIISKYHPNAKVDQTELTVILENGSTIYISGAQDESEIEKFRGMALYKVYIDEAQSFRPYIQFLVDDIIVPALYDYDGYLCLIGTPGPVRAGFFYTCTQNSEWSQHHWTIFDNPHIEAKAKKSVKEIVDQANRRRGIDSSHPTHLRENLGQWAEDESALVYKYSHGLNSYTEMPKGEMFYIMGVDIGYNDADAIAILGYNLTDKNVYLVEEFIQPKQNITQLVEQVQRLEAIYRPVRKVMDAGALGKKIQEEIRFRHGIHLESAEKHRKLEFIELLNDDLRTAKFKAKGNSRYAEDCFLVQWDYSNPGKPKVSDKYHTDIGDAVLYAWRECKHYLSEKPIQEPKIGTKAYMKQMEELEAEKMAESLKKTSMDDILSSQDDMDSLVDDIIDVYE